jgi:hypothetical protein
VRFTALPAMLPQHLFLQAAQLPLKFKPAISATILDFLCLHLMARDDDGAVESLSAMTLSRRWETPGILGRPQTEGHRHFLLCCVVGRASRY